jgi:hypothetical protein
MSTANMADVSFSVLQATCGKSQILRFFEHFFQDGLHQQKRVYRVKGESENHRTHNHER